MCLMCNSVSLSLFCGYLLLSGHLLDFRVFESYLNYSEIFKNTSCLILDSFHSSLLVIVLI